MNAISRIERPATASWREEQRRQQASDTATDKLRRADAHMLMAHLELLEAGLTSEGAGHRIRCFCDLFDPHPAPDVGPHTAALALAQYAAHVGASGRQIVASLSMLAGLPDWPSAAELAEITIAALTAEGRL